VDSRRALELDLGVRGGVSDPLAPFVLTVVVMLAAGALETEYNGGECGKEDDEE
jgi:hypothetical protein